MAPFSGSRTVASIFQVGDDGSGAAALELESSGAATALKDGLEREDGGRAVTPFPGSRTRTFRGPRTVADIFGHGDARSGAGP